MVRKLIIFCLIFALFPIFSIKAKDAVPIDFFYSETCPHCIAEQGFLDTIEEKYPDVSIKRFVITKKENVALLEKRLKDIDEERYKGIVPITFVGEELFVGYDNEEGVGSAIEEAIQRQLSGEEADTENIIRVPFLGELNLDTYSLPALAVILGILDGFNVCSLGALALILGLALAMRDRKKIALFGGAFIITTAIIYGVLIFLWFILFSSLARFIGVFEFIIGLIGIIGGLYFIKEFWRMKRYGVTCDSSGLPIVGKLTQKVQHAMEHKSGIIGITTAVVLFAGILTIVEFPCSAAVPVIFAGVLANAHLSPIVYGLYISLFVLFYLLDELIVFVIAVYTLSLWLSKPRFTLSITLIEALILITIGLYYVLKVVF